MVQYLIKNLLYGDETQLRLLLLDKHDRDFPSQIDFMTKDLPSISQVDMTNHVPYKKFINTIKNRVLKWYIKITIAVNDKHKTKTIALVDFRAYQSCIKKGLVITKFYDKITDKWL